MDNLLQRKITPTSMCPRCSFHVETLPHAIFGCPRIKASWRKSDFEDLWKLCMKGSMFLSLNYAFDSLDNSRLLEFVILCWKCWLNRNLFVYGHEEYDCEIDFSWAAAFVLDYQASTVALSHQNNSHVVFG